MIGTNLDDSFKVYMDHYIDVITSVMTTRLDQRLANFGHKYRCGSIAELPFPTRIIKRDDIVTLLQKVYGVVEVHLGKAENTIPIYISIYSEYFDNPVIFSDVKRDIHNLLTHGLPPDTNYVLALKPYLLTA